ncbi:hypothetical protein O4O00_03250 [Citrobacter sedlakii]|uniref:hypothetical protein n=1 Tax=Citrobacter sedlakii TaxID=67826 RepID=UPI0022B38AE0|nr:hypothetical protein [Citrobacter sedlakii]MCZ4673402.1 hypothetical protein [Citrobacter sedlakii]MDR5003458.1 hypothetical protein [Citrobacter sedlakii]
MDDVILFNGVQGVSLLVPADFGLDAIEVGKKDAPEGLEFWVIERSLLPNTPQSEWNINDVTQRKPDGFGSGQTSK